MGRDLTRNYRPTVRSDYNDAPGKRRNKMTENVNKSWQGRQNPIGKKQKKSKMMPKELKSVISLAVSHKNKTENSV